MNNKFFRSGKIISRPKKKQKKKFFFHNFSSRESTHHICIKVVLEVCLKQYPDKSNNIIGERGYYFIFMHTEWKESLKIKIRRGERRVKKNSSNKTFKKCKLQEKKFYNCKDSGEHTSLYLYIYAFVKRNVQERSSRMGNINSG